MTREDLENQIADYIVDTAEEFASAIDWRIENDALDYAEYRLNQHGWFKRGTCKWVESYCSNCGMPDPSCGDAKFCAYCGARVVE